MEKLSKFDIILTILEFFFKVLEFVAYTNNFLAKLFVIMDESGL